MKILFLAPANSIHTKKWASAFKIDNEVIVCSIHRDISIDAKVYYLPIKNKIGYYLNALFLGMIVKKIKPDIINVHYASGYGTLARIARLKRYILNVWGSDVFDFPFESKLKMCIIKKNLKHAFQIASTSEVMKEQVLRLIKPRREIVVIPFGVDTKLFKPSIKPRNDKFIVGTVKTLSPQYGISTLIRAFDYAMTLGMRNTELIIVGGGKQMNELKKLACSLPSFRQIQFIGPVNHNDVLDYLAKFDIYVALSERESYGVAVVEAESCGIPVVVSSAGGLPEVVDGNISGFIVSIGDWKNAGEKIYQLYNNEGLRKTMGQEGRKLVLQRYDWNNCVNMMKAVFQSCL
jgi:glycosyltransferase involved in cell wall biosynthesis